MNLSKALIFLVLITTAVFTTLGMSYHVQGAGLQPVLCVLALTFCWGLLALHLNTCIDYENYLENKVETQEFIEKVYISDIATSNKLVAAQKEIILELQEKIKKGKNNEH